MARVGDAEEARGNGAQSAAGDKEFDAGIINLNRCFDFRGLRAGSV